MSKKFIKSYNPEWPKKFKEEKKKLRKALEEEFISIEHIGSTSIQGLASKPIIDIAVLVDSIKGVEDYVSKVSSLGYDYKPKLSSPERIFFRKGNPVEYHLSITSKKYDFWSRNIDFRNCLRKDSKLARQYEKIKKESLENIPEKDYDDLSLSKKYNKYKEDFIQKVLERCHS